MKTATGFRVDRCIPVNLSKAGATLRCGGRRDLLARCFLFPGVHPSGECSPAIRCVAGWIDKTVKGKHVEPGVGCGWFLPGGARRDSRRGIEIAPLPELEDEQLPESQRVIAAPGKMLLHQPIHEPGLEVPSLPGPSR